jgi:anti-sigma factor ChrR (cupin superfamily)
MNNGFVDSGFSFADAAAIPWQPSAVAPGVQIKKLGKADGRGMLLVRFQSGANYPIHRHTGPEFIYMLEGEAIQNGQVLQPGWAGVAAAGTMDREFKSETGCIFLLIYDVQSEMPATGH